MWNSGGTTELEKLRNTAQASGREHDLVAVGRGARGHAGNLTKGCRLPRFRGESATLKGLQGNRKYAIMCLY